MSQKILCIEVDEALRAEVRRSLEVEGFAVDEARTGLAGIERARTLPPDLLLVGMGLSDIRGTELATCLKQDPLLATVPFVAIGLSGDEHDAAITAGYDGFVARPLEGTRLADVLRSVLSGSREKPGEKGELAGLRSYAASLAVRLGQALSEAQRSSARLDEVNQRKRAFMHNLAHEISSPLTPLAGYMKILQLGKLGALAPEQQRVVESMMSSVGRLTRIADNLSDFADLEAGVSPMVTSPIDPNTLADDVVAELRSHVKEARLHVAVVHAEGGAVQADRRKLRQALANMVGNAVKFSSHGGEVLVEVAREGDRLRFSVYDQGPGVTDAEEGRIFEPFHHAARHDEARQPGSGLGLPVARRIAEAHGGRVWVESPPRIQPSSQRHFTGSKFVLEIPALPADAPAPTAEGVVGQA